MANSFVKFYRLPSTTYTSADYTKDANGIYFITDTHELIVNGTNYGMSSTLVEKLEGAIGKVEFTSPNTIVFTNVKGDKEITVSLPNATKTVAGLMSAADKTALDTLKGGVAVEGSVQKQVADALSAAKGYTDTQIQSLDVDDAAVVGSYVSAVSETDGKIKVTRAELPTVAEIKSEGQAIVAVKEDKGVISATAGDIAAAHVTVADTSNHFTATTVEGVLNELYTKSGEGATVTIESKAGSGDVLKTYTIKQGGFSVGTIDIPKDLVVSSGSVVKGNWVSGSFTESESGTGTALKLVIANQSNPVYINTLDLVKDHTAGNGINISDTNVVSVKLDTDSEKFLTVGANGVKLSGVAAHVTSEIQKLDSTKSSAADAKAVVTVVEADGKITNVSLEDKDIASAALLGTKNDASTVESAFGRIAKEVAERKAAIQALDATVDSTGGSHVDVQVVEADGKITGVTVSETDIASAKGLSDEVTRATAAEDKIEASVGLATDGSHVTTKGNYTKNANTIAGEISALDTQVKKNADAIGVLNGSGAGSVSKAVADAKAAILGDAATDYNTLGKLEDQIQAVSSTAAKAHTVVNAKSSGFVKVTVAKSADNTHDVVTVSESGIASAADLTSEISNRKAVTGIDGNTYSAHSGNTIIKNATSLHDADLKLANKLNAVSSSVDSLSSSVVKNVTVNGVDATVASNKATVTINGANIKLNGYTTSTTGGAIATTDTVNAALGKLEYMLSWHEAN